MTPVPGIDLSQFDEAFERADGSRPRPHSVPDGQYEVTVEKIEFYQTTTAGPAMKWTLRITTQGAHYNQLLWKTTVLNDKTMGIVKDDLLICGMSIRKLSELSGRVGELLDIPLQVTKRTNGKWEDVYFNRRLDQEADSDDLPF